MRNRPNAGNGYKLRLSAAVTDLGVIYYGSDKTYITDVRGQGYMNAQALGSKLINPASFRNYAVQQGFRTDSTPDNVRMYLPATAVLSADMQVYQRFYINATCFANIMDRKLYGNTFYTQVSLIPRYDSRMLGIGLPVTYSSLSREVKVGIGVRVTGVFFGSDDITALFGSKGRGFGCYAGGYIPLYKRRATYEYRAPPQPGAPTILPK